MPQNPSLSCRFAQPPSYTAHITEHQAEEQVVAIKAFAAVLDAVSNWPKLELPNGITSPSYSAEETPSPGAKLLSLATDVLGKLKVGKAGQQGPGPAPSPCHPVWGQDAVLSSDALTLLKFLLR